MSLKGREEVQAFLRRKWATDLGYRLLVAYTRSPAADLPLASEVATLKGLALMDCRQGLQCELSPQ